MYSHLLRLQKKITFFCVTDTINPSLECLPWFDKIRHDFPQQADLVISFDCGGRDRLGVEEVPFLINIDHHASNRGYGEINLVRTEAISTTQVLYDFFVENGIKINAKMATALYAGLLDDSDAFLSAKVSSGTFKMAATLLECGADSELCNRALFKSVSLAAQRLKGEMLQQCRLYYEGRVAVTEVSREMMESTGALAVDCEAPLNESLYLPTVQVAVMIRERKSGGFKVSLRGEGSADLAAVAEHFGGGGHRHSAGFIFEADGMNDALTRILTKLDKELV